LNGFDVERYQAALRHIALAIGATAVRKYPLN